VSVVGRPVAVRLAAEFPTESDFPGRLRRWSGVGLLGRRQEAVLSRPCRHQRARRACLDLCRAYFDQSIVAVAVSGPMRWPGRPARRACGLRSTVLRLVAFALRAAASAAASARWAARLGVEVRIALAVAVVVSIPSMFAYCSVSTWSPYALAALMASMSSEAIAASSRVGGVHGGDECVPHGLVLVFVANLHRFREQFVSGVGRTKLPLPGRRRSGPGSGVSRSARWAVMLAMP